MSDTRDIETLCPSIFDRLIDEDPDRRGPDLPKSRTVLVRDLCRSVGRDLSRMLNTRRFHVPLPADLLELHPACLDYGIRDFSGADISSKTARGELRDHIERAIRRHEPRFQRVTVELLDNTDPSDRTLRLRINAILRQDSVLEPIVFDTVVEPANCGVSVEGRSNE